jgi:translation elongation factor EF-1beta
MLRMKCVIVDDLTCTEDIFESIQELYPEDVQSVDTVSFNKA